MTYVYKRGKGVNRRVFHLARYNPDGQISGVWCSTKLKYDTTINVPLGKRICKHCEKVRGKVRGDEHINQG